MFKKTTAIILSAVIMAGASAVASAQDIPQLETASVVQELGASSAKTWDGKAELQAGKKYVLKKSVTISSDVTVPKGTTLTLNKGAKITVAKAGSLTINGKVIMRAGSALTVNGTLTTAKGSTVSASGAIKFGKNKANVTLGGKLTVNKSGTISGTPKSIELGNKAKVSVKGKNTCKKLKALLKGTAADVKQNIEQDKQEIQNMFDDMFKMAIVDNDLYGTYKKYYPAAVLKELEASFAEMGMSFEGYCKSFLDLIKEYVGEEEFAKVAQAKIIVTNITDCKDKLTDEVKAMFVDSGDITKAYLVDYTIDAQGVEGVLSDSGQNVVVYAGGNWYFAG